MIALPSRHNTARPHPFTFAHTPSAHTPFVTRSFAPWRAVPRAPAPVTPDGRYIVVRGRLWRRANPNLPESQRQKLVDALMKARRAVRDALRGNDTPDLRPDDLRHARAAVDAVKQKLGERGPVWWNDGAPDCNRRMARTTCYADWWAATEETESLANTAYKAERLAYEDEVLGEIALPGGTLRMTRGLGSGLTRRAGDPPGTVWAIGDRGPNFKVKLARKRYGVEGLDPLRGIDGAKIMPALEHGPALVELRVEGTRVTAVRALALRGANDAPLSGLPVPASQAAECEPIFGLDGRPLGTDPSGVDSEGTEACADGGFWIGDEYGPSLLRTDAHGMVTSRWVPADSHVHYEGAAYPVVAALPAIASARRLNRGFEALALSADEHWLTLAFQSPLAHPDRAAHESSRNLRLWRLEAATGALAAEYLYPLDPSHAFRRDIALGEFRQSDVKVSEILMLDDDHLLVLERGSASTKFYRVRLGDEHIVPSAFSDPETRPTLEQLDDPALAAAGIVPLAKTLVLDTDDAPDIPADLEGAVLLSPTELLIVNDSDFGVEGVATQFWRITFDTPVATFVGAG